MSNQLLRFSATSLATVLLLSPSSYADSSRYEQAKWTHFGVRPLAMGNAYVAVADDFNALFYNPAGLARLKEWHGEFLNPGLEISADTLDFMQDATKFVGGKDSNNKAVLELIDKNTGKNHHMAIEWTPHLVFPGIGFGIGTDIDMSMTFKKYPSALINSGPRIILPVAYARNFMENRLSIGAAVKARYRMGINHEFTIQDIDDLKNTKDSKRLDQFVEQGRGFGADVGMLFTPMKPMEPTIGVSITDVGGTNYTAMDLGGKKTAAPDRVLPSVNIGLSAKPMQTDRMYLMTSADMQSINQPFDFSKKFNLGAEVGLGEIFKVQGGFHQGYLSGGFELDVTLLALRFASYIEELGSTAGSIPDHRYLFEVKLLI